MESIVLLYLRGRHLMRVCHGYNRHVLFPFARDLRHNRSHDYPRIRHHRADSMDADHGGPAGGVLDDAGTPCARDVLPAARPRPRDGVRRGADAALARMDEPGVADPARVLPDVPLVAAPR